jgi:hypothetical protein
MAALANVDRLLWVDCGSSEVAYSLSDQAYIPRDEVLVLTVQGATVN